MPSPRYIAVEGPIGVGKTSFAKKLAEDFNARLILEEADANPFLAPFYKDRAKHALKTQLLFLINRYLQQKELAQQDLFQRTVVCDYLFAKDRIFAALNLGKDEMFLYEKIYSLLDTNLPKPDLVVFLQASPEILIKHIKKRGIDYERNIDSSYLKELIDAYNRFFFSYTDTPLVVVNVSDIDFVKRKVDYESLVREILSDKKGEKHYVSIGR
ncbi:MAG: deoxynucleoside kinase [Deltaproteobacteria bacterium]|nr:deoxynucleoside kinase [Deltaproteobacteria bacterium]